ncbi:2-phospho-L-lactate guanylyltransferase [Microlunatus sp. Y2014]|uniref:2-phospho-L-lactate guanylyltransferase n=1 Tax=Microlunatus sp. Y2014 TaxID=3418488 RepID=UPI003DA709F2
MISRSAADGVGTAGATAASSPYRVGAIVLAKPFVRGKSRLADLPSELRLQLSWAMLLDTCVAVTAVADELVVVSDEPRLQERLEPHLGRVTVLADPGGMNTAVAAAAATLPAGPTDVQVAVVADLPTLRPADVRHVVEQARQRGYVFVSDTEGVGTTMVASCGQRLESRFGKGSAAAHLAAGAALVATEFPTARRDVDLPADLAAAAQLSPGIHTSWLIERT